MRVPNEVLYDQQWRIHEVLGDFPLEDLWQLPTVAGTRDEFREVVDLFANADPARESPAPVKFLWNARDLLGKWLGLGEIAAAADAPPRDSLLGQVPDDLSGTADDVHFAALPFIPLYRTETEFAAEVANKTMHGVMHLGWLPQSGEAFSLQMAVYVRANGRAGRAYMEFIKPFRYLIVYPQLERHLERLWNARGRSR